MGYVDLHNPQQHRTNGNLAKVAEENRRKERLRMEKIRKANLERRRKLRAKLKQQSNEKESAYQDALKYRKQQKRANDPLRKLRDQRDKLEKMQKRALQNVTNDYRKRQTIKVNKCDKKGVEIKETTPKHEISKIQSQKAIERHRETLKPEKKEKKEDTIRDSTALFKAAEKMAKTNMRVSQAVTALGAPSGDTMSAIKPRRNSIQKQRKHYRDIPKSPMSTISTLTTLTTQTEPMNLQLLKRARHVHKDHDNISIISAPNRTKVMKSFKKVPSRRSSRPWREPPKQFMENQRNRKRRVVTGYSKDIAALEASMARLDQKYTTAKKNIKVHAMEYEELTRQEIDRRKQIAKMEEDRKRRRAEELKQVRPNIPKEDYSKYVLGPNSPRTPIKQHRASPMKSPRSGKRHSVTNQMNTLTPIQPSMPTPSRFDYKPSLIKPKAAKELSNQRHFRHYTAAPLHNKPSSPKCGAISRPSRDNRSPKATNEETFVAPLLPTPEKFEKPSTSSISSSLDRTLNSMNLNDEDIKPRGALKRRRPRTKRPTVSNPQRNNVIKAKSNALTLLGLA